MSRLTSGIASGKSRHAIGERDRREQRVRDPERGLAGPATAATVALDRMRRQARTPITPRAASAAIAVVGRARAARAAPPPCARRAAAAAARSPAASTENRIGVPTCGTLPASGCGRSMRMPRATICGSANTWSMRVDRPARHAERLERREPVALRARPHHVGDQRHEHRRDCARGRRSSRSAGPPPTPAARGLAELRELGVVADREDHVAVGAGEHLVGNDVLVRVAGASGRRAGDEVVHVHHRHHRDRRIEEARVDPLPLPGALAMRERRLDRHASRTCRS